jgi:hypothetical protein
MELFNKMKILSVNVVNGQVGVRKHKSQLKFSWLSNLNHKLIDNFIFHRNGTIIGISDFIERGFRHI